MRVAVQPYLFVKSRANRLNSLVWAKKTEALEPFHPDRVASRILGMGDVLSLIEDLERSVDREKSGKNGAEIQERR